MQQPSRAVSTTSINTGDRSQQPYYFNANNKPGYSLGPTRLPPTGPVVSDGYPARQQAHPSSSSFLLDHPSLSQLSGRSHQLHHQTYPHHFSPMMGLHPGQTTPYPGPASNFGRTTVGTIHTVSDGNNNIPEGTYLNYDSNADALHALKRVPNGLDERRSVMMDKLTMGMGQREGSYLTNINDTIKTIPYPDPRQHRNNVSHKSPANPSTIPSVPVPNHDLMGMMFSLQQKNLAVAAAKQQQQHILAAESYMMNKQHQEFLMAAAAAAAQYQQHQQRLMLGAMMSGGPEALASSLTAASPVGGGYTAYPPHPLLASVPGWMLAAQGIAATTTPTTRPFPPQYYGSQPTPAPTIATSQRPVSMASKSRRPGTPVQTGPPITPYQLPHPFFGLPPFAPPLVSSVMTMGSALAGPYPPLIYPLAVTGQTGPPGSTTAAHKALLKSTLSPLSLQVRGTAALGSVTPETGEGCFNYGLQLPYGGGSHNTVDPFAKNVPLDASAKVSAIYPSAAHLGSAYKGPSYEDIWNTFKKQSPNSHNYYHNTNVPNSALPQHEPPPLNLRRANQQAIGADKNQPSMINGGTTLLDRSHHTPAVQSQHESPFASRRPVTAADHSIESQIEFLRCLGVPAAYINSFEPSPLPKAGKAEPRVTAAAAKRRTALLDPSPHPTPPTKNQGPAAPARTHGGRRAEQQGPSADQTAVLNCGRPAFNPFALLKSRIIADIRTLDTCIETLEGKMDSLSQSKTDLSKELNYRFTKICPDSVVQKTLVHCSQRLERLEKEADVIMNACVWKDVIRANQETAQQSRHRISLTDEGLQFLKHDSGVIHNDDGNNNVTRKFLNQLLRPDPTSDRMTKVVMETVKLEIRTKRKHYFDKYKELEEVYQEKMVVWKEAVAKSKKVVKRRNKDAKVREFFENQYPELRDDRMEKERLKRIWTRNTMGNYARTETDVEEISKRLHEQEEEKKRLYRLSATIPKLLDADQRASESRYVYLDPYRLVTLGGSTLSTQTLQALGPCPTDRVLASDSLVREETPSQTRLFVGDDEPAVNDQTPVIEETTGMGQQSLGVKVGCDGSDKNIDGPPDTGSSGKVGEGSAALEFDMYRFVDPLTERAIVVRYCNIWTEREQEIFRKYYATNPKEFGTISQHLAHKSTADCVLHYYLTKKEENYKKLIKKKIVKKRKINSKSQNVSSTSCISSTSTPCNTANRKILPPALTKSSPNSSLSLNLLNSSPTSKVSSTASVSPTAGQNLEIPPQDSSDDATNLEPLVIQKFKIKDADGVLKSTLDPLERGRSYEPGEKRVCDGDNHTIKVVSSPSKSDQNGRTTIFLNSNKSPTMNKTAAIEQPHALLQTPNTLPTSLTPYTGTKKLRVDNGKAFDTTASSSSPKTQTTRSTLCHPSLPFVTKIPLNLPPFPKNEDGSEDYFKILRRPNSEPQLFINLSTPVIHIGSHSSHPDLSRINSTNRAKLSSKMSPLITQRFEKLVSRDEEKSREITTVPSAKATSPTMKTTSSPLYDPYDFGSTEPTEPRNDCPSGVSQRHSLPQSVQNTRSPGTTNTTFQYDTTCGLTNTSEQGIKRRLDVETGVGHSCLPSPPKDTKDQDGPSFTGARHKKFRESVTALPVPKTTSLEPSEGGGSAVPNDFKETLIASTSTPLNTLTHTESKTLGSVTGPNFVLPVTTNKSFDRPKPAPRDCYDKNVAGRNRGNHQTYLNQEDAACQAFLAALPKDESQQPALLMLSQPSLSDMASGPGTHRRLNQHYISKRYLPTSDDLLGAVIMHQINQTVDDADSIKLWNPLRLHHQHPNPTTNTNNTTLDTGSPAPYDGVGGGRYYDYLFPNPEGLALGSQETVAPLVSNIKGEGSLDNVIPPPPSPSVSS